MLPTFFFNVIPVTENFTGSVRQYFVGKNMMEIAHLLIGDNLMKSV